MGSTQGRGCSGLAVSVQPDPATIVKKITAVERQRRFDDRAVVGGLAHFLAGMGQRLNLPPDLWELLRGYHSLSPAARAPAIAELERALDQEPTRAGPGKAPGAPSPQPSPRGRGSSAPPASPEMGGTPLPLPVGEAGRRPAGPRSGEGGPLKAPTPVQRLPAAPASTVSPSTSLSALSGVGPTRAKRLLALGLETAGDLRLHLPHRYLAYPPPQRASELGFQNLASFEGMITEVTETRLPGSRRRIAAVLRDDTGSVTATWIRGGQYPMGLRQGTRLAISGPLVRFGRQISFENPDYEPAERPPLHTRRNVPDRKSVV